MDTTTNQRQLVGWLFCEPDQALFSVSEHKITPDHLTDAFCRSVLIAALKHKETGRPSDHWLIGQTAKRENIEIDPIEWQRCADEAIVIPGQLVPHLLAIKSAYMASEAVNIMRRGAAELKDAEDTAATISGIQARLADLQASTIAASGQVHHITDHRAATVERWRNARNAGFVGIPSSIKQIDAALGGYRRKVMCILGGYRGEGKSLFMRQELLAASRRGFKSLLICLEDPEDMAAAIVVGNATRRSIFSLDVGHASDRHIEEIDEGWAGLSDLPLWTAGARTIEDIEAVCLAHKSRYGLDFIGIDHIQYISPYQRPKMDRNGTVAMYSNRICGLLKDTDAAGLVASQFSRNAEKDSRRPRLSDLRDSGTIEQDCRQALLLSRDADGHIIEVAKNNFGPSSVDIGLFRVSGEHRFDYRELPGKGAGMV